MKQLDLIAGTGMAMISFGIPVALGALGYILDGLRMAVAFGAAGTVAVGWWLLESAVAAAKDDRGDDA